MIERDEVEDAPVAAPRFCPRCLKPDVSGTALCPECGESLRDQGYCGVCERRWTRAPGDLCPKHDVPLDGGPPAKMQSRGGPWVTVATYSQAFAAEGARIRLEAEGIPTFLEGERMGGHGEFQIATGGIRLQVPEDLSDEARIVISQVWTPVDGDDLDDAWEDFEREPGSTRRSIMKFMIVFILLLPAIQAIIVALTR